MTLTILTVMTIMNFRKACRASLAQDAKAEIAFSIA